MRWTDEQLADYERRKGARVDTSAPPFLPPANEAGAFARGKLKPREMNKTEAAYDAHLRARQLAGDIVWYAFEAVKLRLADNTYYTPDFFVLCRDFVLEVHETKGFWRDDARVKIKVAAAQFPFRFFGITKERDGWLREEFS